MAAAACGLALVCRRQWDAQVYVTARYRCLQPPGTEGIFAQVAKEAVNEI